MYTSIKRSIRSLFLERNSASIAFNRILIILNIAVFVLLGFEWTYPETPILHTIETGLGMLFLIEYLVRLWIAPHKWYFIRNIYSILDIIVLVSLFAPLLAGNFAILRILRSLKILRSYYLVQLASHNKTIAKRQGTILAMLNFFAFLGVMTAVVFTAEAQYNPQITSYFDALYFSVATITTTGYGDITLVGPYGRVIAIVGMICGITLFLRLAHSMLRGTYVSYTCPSCGLDEHDLDASHCKHCGRPVLHEHHAFA